MSRPQESSGSGRISEFVSQELELRRSNRKSTPHCHFEIEGEAFLITSQDSDEPRTVHKALSCLTEEQ